MGQNYTEGLLDGFTIRRGDPTPLTVADSNTLATFVAANPTPFDCKGRSYLKLRADFDTNARTSKVRVLFFSYDTDSELDDKYLCQTEELDLAACSLVDDGSRYKSDVDVPVPTDGYQKFRIQLTSISGGNIRIYTPTFA